VRKALSAAMKMASMVEVYEAEFGSWGKPHYSPEIAFIAPQKTVVCCVDATQ
jgi:hypothetical protein